MSDFRTSYRARIPSWYRGPVHAAWNIGAPLLAALALVAFVERPLWWELLVVPATLLYANVVEYVLHRWPLHHPMGPLRFAWERHTGEHHRFFPEDAMEAPDSRDWKAVLFPPHLALLALLGVLPGAVLLNALGSPNAALLHAATGIAYFSLYEALHLAWHLPRFAAWGGHHARHHDPALMRTANFNVTFPVLDRLVGTCAPPRSSLGPRLRFPGWVLAVVAGTYAVHVLSLSRELEPLEPLALDCTPIEGAPGAEDIAWLPDGTAIVSSSDRWAVIAGEDVPGHLFRYDPVTGGLTDMTPAGLWQPHGVDVWTDGHETRVFVVEHERLGATGGGRHRVGIYRLTGDHLERVLAVEGLVSPNDVAASGPDSFYVTNDHGSGGGLSRYLEELVVLRRATVQHWDGEELTTALTGLSYANGIAWREGELWVSEVMRHDLVVYRPTPDGLVRHRAIRLTSAPDNLTLAEDGSLWVGAHPRPLRFARHAASHTPAPSEALRVAPDGTVTAEWRDDGSLLSASAVAAPRGGHLLVGPVFDAHFLDCKL